MTTSTLTSTFSKSKTWYSDPLNRCFKISLTGTVQATLEKNGRGRTLKNPRISGTHMSVRVGKQTDCGTAATVAKLELRQYYYDRKCEVRPSVSAGVGGSPSGPSMSIGVSATNICSDFQTGYRDSTYDSAPDSSFNQHSTGSGVQWSGIKESWSNYTGTPQTASYHEVCVKGEFEMQPYFANGNDDLLKFTFSDICQGVTA